MMRLRHILIPLAILLTSCGQKVQEVQTRAFPVVGIPSMYTEPIERVEYAAQHYWDAFLPTTKKDFASDSTMLFEVKIEDVETSFSTWLAVLGQQALPDAQKSVSRFFSRLEACEAADTASHIVSRMAAIVDKYLYDPNSPYRDEDLYLPFVDALSKSQYVPENLRASYAFDARMCSLNQHGQKAADFRFIDIEGREHRLYDLPGDFTLLFFSNPGCQACKEIIEQLSSIPSIGMMIEEGSLSVANVYIDEDVDAWRDYQDFYPDEWYNGYDPDQTIRQDLLYCVRGIPSLYLLDKEKSVLFKDAPTEKVLGFLSSL